MISRYSAETLERRREYTRSWRERNKHQLVAGKLAPTPEDRQRVSREAYTKMAASRKARGLNQRGKTPAEERASALLRKYGITSDQWDQMWSDQGGGCAICFEPLRRGSGGAAVDHDHKTGKVRKLLCACCNTALGKFRDNPEIIRRAAAYVENHA